MRAVYFERFGEPASVLSVQERDRPYPEPGEVVVRVRARPINPSDLLPVRGVYRHRTRLPSVPGYEGAGVVTAAADDVDELSVGTRVLPLRGGGTWQEYVRAPAAWCARVPRGIPDGAACQLYVNPLTAWLVLTDVLRLRPGDVVVANAGGSAFVHMLIQLAHVVGVRVIALARSPTHTDRLLKLGAYAVVAERAEAVPEVLALTGGIGATAALDAVGGTAGAEFARCIRQGGTLVPYGLLSGQPLALTDAQARVQRLSVQAFWLRAWVQRASAAQFHSAFETLLRLVTSGHVVLPPVGATYNLGGVREAALAAVQPGRKGKVVLSS